MNEEEKEKLQEIVNNLDRDVKLPPYNISTERGYSREYKQYREEEEQENQRTWFERLCLKSGSLLNLSASEDMREDLMPSIRLMDYEVSPGMVASAAVLTGFGAFVGWFFIFLLNMLLGFIIPFSIAAMTVLVPIGVGIYIYYKPKIDAQNKVLNSSGEMIMAILYMVVYMRSSPNLEGAVRFAAVNLTGPISEDLKKVLWDVEIGKYSTVSESLHEYTRVWKDFNEDFLESLQLIEAAMQDPNKDRREEMLRNAVDSILDGTREKMKHYAQELKTPVMILNALGAMLPVLGMIMLPIISVFLGAAITGFHLILFYNIMLPTVLYWFMKRVLSSRPPTTTTRSLSKERMPPRNTIKKELLGREISFSSWWIGAAIFLIVSLYGVFGYISYPEFFPATNSTNLNAAPDLYTIGDNRLNPIPMLLRSLSITYALGLGLGVALLLGNRRRKEKEDELNKIESQFPEALFQLGNKVSGGQPIELALEDAADATSDLEISGLFRKASENVRNLGMTLSQALFDKTHGALVQYPSQRIYTVMKAMLESSGKGSEMVSMAMMTISKYLRNIHDTQEKLNDIMQETVSTLNMLAFILAPVISGVAVGMSQTIITAMSRIYASFQSQAAVGAGTGGGVAQSGVAILGNLSDVVAPEMLQFVVGVYLVQLLFIVGTFYTKIMKGNDKTFRNLYVGKVLIVACTLYSIVVILVGVIFGSLVSSIGGI